MTAYYRRLVRAPGTALPDAAQSALVVERDELLAALRLDCSERQTAAGEPCPETWTLMHYPRMFPSAEYKHGEYRLAPALLEMRAQLTLMADSPNRTLAGEQFLDIFDHWLDELHEVCNCGNASGDPRATEYGAPH